MSTRSAFGGPLLFCCGAMVVAETACAPGHRNNREATIAEVESAIDGTIAWARTKDFDWLYGIIANDSAYLEVQPEDVVIKGFTAFQKNAEFFASPDFRAIRYEIKDLQITVSRTGDVAWFFCMLDDINDWQGQPASWINVRWTGVLERRDGKWVMVQMHFSNPVAG